MKQKNDKECLIVVHQNGVMARTKNKRLLLAKNKNGKDAVQIELQQVEDIDEFPVVHYIKLRKNYFANGISLKHKTAQMLYSALGEYLKLQK